MAIPSTAIWEVETGGSDTLNGSSFDPGNANMATNGAATSANTIFPVFTSASYNFVSGDVGAWLFIKSGADWIPGWYKIISVAANAATLNATAGAAALLPTSNSLSTSQPYNVNTGIGCAGLASPINATWTIDYSQGSVIALSGLTTSGANAIILTASATVAMVGNGLVIKAGTNFTTGYYSISSVSAGVSITVDRNVASGVGASGTAGIGGAMATLGQVATVFVAGNSAWIQSGTYTVSATTTFNVATTLPAISYISGYHLVRTDSDGTRPIITSSTSSVTLLTIGASATNFRITNIKFTHTGSPRGIGVSISTSSFCYVINCLFDGCLNGLSLISGAWANVHFSSIINSTGDGIILAGSTISKAFVRSCFIYNSTGGYGINMAPISAFGQINAYRCVIANNSSGGINIVNTANQANVRAVECTIANNTGNGITFTYGGDNLAQDIYFLNNLFYGNSGWGILFNSGAETSEVYGNYNLYGNNSSGQSKNLHTEFNAVTLSSSDPFTNAAGGDFSLNSSAGASVKAAGFPGAFPGGWSHIQDTGVATSGGPTLGLNPFPRSTVINNYVVVFVWGIGGFTPTLVACTDNAVVPNTYTQIAIKSDGNADWCSILIGKITSNPSSGTLTLTVSPGGITATVSCASEFDGGTATLDGIAVVNNGSSGTPSPGNMSASTGDLLLACFMNVNVSASVPVTTPTGYTDSGKQTNGNTSVVGEGVWQVATTSSTYNPTWDDTGAMRWVAAQVALKASTGARGYLDGGAVQHQQALNPIAQMTGARTVGVY